MTKGIKRGEKEKKISAEMVKERMKAIESEEVSDKDATGR